MEMSNRPQSTFSLPPLDVNGKSLSIFSPPQHVSLFSTSNQKILQKKLNLLERLQSTTSEDSVDIIMDEQQQQSNTHKESNTNTAEKTTATLHANSKHQQTQQNNEEDEEDDLFTRLAKQTGSSEGVRIAHQHGNIGVAGHFPATIPSYAYAIATNRSKRRPGDANAQQAFHSRPPHAFTAAAASSSAAAAASSQGLIAAAWQAGWPRFHSAEVDCQERMQQQQQQIHTTMILTHPASQPMLLRYLPSAHAAPTTSSSSAVTDDLATLRRSPSPPPPLQSDSQLCQPHKASDSDAPEKAANDAHEHARALHMQLQQARRLSVNSIGVNDRLMAMAMKIHQNADFAKRASQSHSQNTAVAIANASIASTNSTTNSSPSMQLLTRPLSLPINSHLNDFQSNPAFRSTDRNQMRSIRNGSHIEMTEHEELHTHTPSPAASPSPRQPLSASESAAASRSSRSLRSRNVNAVDGSAASPNPHSAVSDVNLAQCTADLPFELLRSGVCVYVPWNRKERQSKRMSDADPHAFYSFSLSAKAPFLFLLRNIHSKRVKLSILLSRIHFICLTNDERASIFISYHGREARAAKSRNKKTEQHHHQPDPPMNNVSNSMSTSSTDSLAKLSNKRHLYLWPIDQRDCLSWFHLILRAWRTFKDVQSYATIPKLNVIETLKKLLNQTGPNTTTTDQHSHHTMAVTATEPRQQLDMEHSCDEEDIDTECDREVEGSTLSQQEDQSCYFCRSSSGSTATPPHKEQSSHTQQLVEQQITPTLRLTPEFKSDNPLNELVLVQPIPARRAIGTVTDGVTVKRSVMADAGGGIALTPIPVVFHSDASGSPVQGQQTAAQPLPLQIELHCIEEGDLDGHGAGKGNDYARSSRAVAVRIARHKRGPSYSAHAFNSPPAPISNPLSSPHYRPIQRSKSNLLPAEEIRQQLVECRSRLQRLELLAARLKKDACVLADRNNSKLASLACRQKILREQNGVLRKIATHRMYERLNQPSVYI